MRQTHMINALPVWRAIAVGAAFSATLLLSTGSTSAPPLLGSIENPLPGSTSFGLTVATGDVNNDGKDDIAATSDAAGGRVVHLFDSDGTFLFTTPAPVPSFALSPAMEDVNDDGKSDIIGFSTTTQRITSSPAPRAPRSWRSQTRLVHLSQQPSPATCRPRT